MKNYTNEFKVGAFIILCVLGLFYLTYSTGKLHFKRSGYHLFVVFNEVAGIEKKAPVMLNGLEVGKVDDIQISYDNNKTQITLKLWLDSQAKIRENPAISIKTLGLMGEKYIQIASSSGEKFIKPNAVIYGKPYLDLDAMMERVQEMSADISQQVSKLLISLNDTVGDNKENVTSIIKNLEASSKNFQEFSEDVKRHPWKLLFKTKEKEAASKTK